MQGAWKNKLNGYNQKGYKRKKQTYKNFLKDKGKGLLNTFEGGISRTNRKIDDGKYYVDKYEVVYKDNDYMIFPIRKTAQIFNVCFWYFKDDVAVSERTYNNRAYISCKAYVKTELCLYPKANSSWVREDGKELQEYFKLSKHEYATMHVFFSTPTSRYIELDWLKEARDKDMRKIIPFIHSNTKEFIYGKLLLSKERRSWFNDGKCRKIAAKYAHSKDRRIWRDWVSKKAWDIEPESNAIGKSIEYEVS